MINFPYNELIYMITDYGLDLRNSSSMCVRNKETNSDYIVYTSKELVNSFACLLYEALALSSCCT